MDERYSVPSELATTLLGLKWHFIYAGAYSAAVNLLMLAPIIYMLQIYDRVITSGSYSTLAMLTLLLLLLIAAMGVLEWVRSMILVAAGSRIEKDLRHRLTDASFRQALATGGRQASAQAFHDMNGIRQFLTSQGAFAFFDVPWFPVYVLIMFLFHPWFGVAAILGGLVMLTLAFANDRSTSRVIEDASRSSAQALTAMTANLKNAESIAAMGMASHLQQRQDKLLDEAWHAQSSTSQKASFWGSFSKAARILMQSLVLGLGAYLALNQQITPGMMIAGSLLLGRALAPIDQLVSAWKGFSVARVQFHRLQRLLEDTPELESSFELPAPRGALQLENIYVLPPSSKTPAVSALSLELSAGEALGIVGPSASGKSSLVRAMLGIWPAAAGVVRLDGADIRQWNRDLLGQYLGYVPQDIELFDGSVSENICRFGSVDAQKIVATARLAGVHDLILRLPQGYDTVLGGGGASLSGGQRQSIALARAVYGEPRLIVLDEPNSNLDEQGERELIQAITRIKATGATLVVVTHRMPMLSGMDRILVMNEGEAVGLGPKEQMLQRLQVVTPLPARQG